MITKNSSCTDLDHVGLEIKLIVYKSKLCIEGDALYAYSTRERPGAFRRFWYWLLLDWRWEEVVQWPEVEADADTRICKEAQ